MSLRPLTLDFETFYTTKDQGAYSLSYMTNEEYIRDPRFEIIGFSLKWEDQPSDWYSGDEAYMASVLRSIDWSQVLLIGQNNAEFDDLILWEKFGIRACAYADIRQMARALGNGRDSYSLDAMTQRYGLQSKGQQVKTYVNKRRADFTAWELADYGSYCGNSRVTAKDGDTDLTWKLFCIFIRDMPPQEMQIASMCARMYCEPRLALHERLLYQLQEDMAVRKSGLLARVADILQVPAHLPHDQRMTQTQTLLRKDAVLADVLKRKYDIDPPLKPSKKKRNPDGTPVMNYAFAKTDEGMDALLNFEDESDPEGAEDIQALAAARIGVKSTLGESRVGRFHGISQRGLLPVPIAYGKTHTHRLAGAQKLNLQNLTGTRQVNEKTLYGTLIRTPRGFDRLNKYNAQTKQIMAMDGTIFDIKHPASGELQVWIAGLRDCIIAPPGMKIVVVDSSQIELRVCHLLAGQLDTVDDLRRGVDTYSSFASTLYGRVITKSDTKERQHGKVGMLQLQYQSGARAFRNSARVMGGIRLSEDEAQHTVDVYRDRFTFVRKYWWTAQQAIKNMAAGGGRYLDQWGLCRTEHNSITMPGFLPLRYHNLRQEMIQFDGQEPELQWVYDDKEKRHAKKIYGGSVTENQCQWIAGNVVKPQTLEIEKKYGNYWRTGEGVVLSVHDEAVMLVREERADECLKFSLEQFRTAPSWWPQLPVDGEGGIGNSYAEAK